VVLPPERQIPLFLPRKNFSHKPSSRPRILSSKSWRRLASLPNNGYVPFRHFFPFETTGFLVFLLPFFSLSPPPGSVKPLNASVAPRGSLWSIFLRYSQVYRSGSEYVLPSICFLLAPRWPPTLRNSVTLGCPISEPFFFWLLSSNFLGITVQGIPPISSLFPGLSDEKGSLNDHSLCFALPFSFFFAPYLFSRFAGGSLLNIAISLLAPQSC